MLLHIFKNFFSKIYKRYLFQRSLKKFIHDPECVLKPKNSIITDMVYGWDNEAWSASKNYLLACIEHALNSDGPILECGTGLSTIVIGIISKKRNIKHIALENDSEWAHKIQKFRNKLNIDTLIYVNELKDYGDFSWYDVPISLLPNDFTLVICDGPPGTTPGGRYGLVPIVGTKLLEGCVILLDDAIRQQELDIAKRWEHELGASNELCGSPDELYIKMVIQTNHT